MNCGFEIVDLKDYHSEALLKRFYEDLYLPAFPITDEREDPGIWARLLWSMDPVPQTPILHRLLIGQNLRRRNQTSIVAGHLFEYYPESSCGFLTYLVVSPLFRGKSAGYFKRLRLTALKRMTFWMNLAGCSMTKTVT
jgi:hypothetical protein